MAALLFVALGCMCVLLHALRACAADCDVVVLGVLAAGAAGLALLCCLCALACACLPPRRRR